ncbi:hypothetical protein BLNAU_1373 [Blattamonas nauphoetae]|uniref:Carrier domain-containing protein n=1 Tax=Blattamonas nauphoetae TaxID=2049346 RepID=A0ABQ9YJ70_9EUKA|nr:hypothetical protein BLNAU_7806 [Blattamonas nauphoetae]KAK2963804.1 hypothetical protein BLNAU_1373 [Blattamonas nauphoetae]
MSRPSDTPTHCKPDLAACRTSTTPASLCRARCCVCHCDPSQLGCDGQHDRAGAATRKRRGADGVAHLGVTQADRERCRELRYTEPVVEKETDEDTIAELAERLQVELTLHALLAELNTIDLTTVLSKTQVLSALSLLYLAASSPVGAAKPRQLNG